MNDTEIIKGIKKKNQRAIEAAFEIYGNLVYKIIYSLMSEGHEKSYVEDCVNEVFLSLWNNIDCYNSEKSSFKNWLAAISKYKAIDYKRKLQNSNLQDNIDDSILCNHISTEDALIQKENKEELLKIINSLKKTDRELFVRKFLLEESVDDIAKSLGITTDNVYTRLYRGRKTLRQKSNLIEEVV